MATLDLSFTNTNGTFAFEILDFAYAEVLFNVKEITPIKDAFGIVFTTTLKGIEYEVGALFFYVDGFYKLSESTLEVRKVSTGRLNKSKNETIKSRIQNIFRIKNVAEAIEEIEAAIEKAQALIGTEDVFAKLAVKKVKRYTAKLEKYKNFLPAAKIEDVKKDSSFENAVELAEKSGFTKKNNVSHELFNNHRTQKFEIVMYSDTQGVEIITYIEGGKNETSVKIWDLKPAAKPTWKETNIYLCGEKVEPENKRIYRVRFNLAKGEFFRFWKIKNMETGEVQFHNPKKVSLSLKNCFLRNQKGTARKIHEGANKSVCAWIEAEQVRIDEPLPAEVTEKYKLSYDPRKNPFWTDHEGNNQDSKVFRTLYTHKNNVLKTC